MQRSPRKNKLCLASLQISPVLGSKLLVTPTDEQSSTVVVTPQMIIGKDFDEQYRLIYCRGEKECKV